MATGSHPRKAGRHFFANAEAIAAIDMCVVPTLTFERLFAFLVLGHSRRQLLWFEVTRHPTAAWLARQITEAFPWASAAGYLLRDNDRAYGQGFTARVMAMGIREADLFWIAMAKWYCRTFYRNLTARVPEPCADFQRAATSCMGCISFALEESRVAPRRLFDRPPSLSPACRVHEINVAKDMQWVF
jgi:hypothetical protein